MGDIASSGRERACDPNDPEALERCFTAILLSRPNLSEISLTRAEAHRVRRERARDTRPRGRWQLTVLRETPNPESPLRTRWTHDASGTYVSDERNPLDASATFTRMSSDAGDPTDHPTFQTPAAKPYVGRRLWSDLSYSQLDAALPEAQQRVVVTLLN